MIISLVNHTKLADADVQKAIRAINVQIEQDFHPYWSIGAILRLEGRIGERLDPRNLAANMRGDAILYLEDSIEHGSDLGFHNLHFSGIPYGFVYTEISEQLKEPWQVTLSHEALELIADAEVNRLIMGPHPDRKEGGRMVFHWYEMCDAVQAESYEIHGVPVSNFVLPLYFTVGIEAGSRNDFLSKMQSNGRRLSPFGINPGGYIGYYDPDTKKHETCFADEDARQRAEVKSQAGFARRGIRYKSQLCEPLETGRVPKDLSKFEPLTEPRSSQTEAEPEPHRSAKKRGRPKKQDARG